MGPDGKGRPLAGNQQGGPDAQGANITAPSITRRRNIAASIGTLPPGWHVFPLVPGSKTPAIARWQQRAIPAGECRPGYWPGPRHNIGTACGPSRLVVVDIDPGGRLDGLPGTFTVATPRGRHLYFAAIPGRVIRNSAGKVAEHVDIRGAGGYVVGPGSVVGGRVYQVTDDRPPAPLPGWLADLADPPRPAEGTPPAPSWPDRYSEAALRGEVTRILAAPVGQRNHTLNSAAFALGQLVAGGMLGCAEVIATLIRAADSCGLVAEDGLRRCERTISSGLTAGMARPRGRVVT